MRITHGHFASITSAPCVATLGNFDGLHRGHRALIAHGLELAQRAGVGLTLITFEPHPRRVFTPSMPPNRLMSLEAQAAVLEELGVEHLIRLTFDEALSSLEGEVFVQDVLRERLRAQHVLVGEGFRFGHGRRGTTETLSRCMDGAATTFKPVCTEEGWILSSSLIRQHIVKGDLERVPELLGGAYTIRGPVLRGDGIGRTMGTPTANIDLGEHLRPPEGIFAVELLKDGLRYPGAGYHGHRPSIQGSMEERFEVHVFDFDGDLYDRHVEVALHRWMRPDRRVHGTEALKAVIQEDCRAIRRYFQG